LTMKVAVAVATRRPSSPSTRHSATPVRWPECSTLAAAVRRSPIRPGAMKLSFRSKLQCCNEPAVHDLVAGPEVDHSQRQLRRQPGRGAPRVEPKRASACRQREVVADGGHQLRDAVARLNLEGDVAFGLAWCLDGEPELHGHSLSEAVGPA
jgi:hypothetical protein